MNTIFYITQTHSIPITLEQAKQFLRVTNQEDDRLITMLINSAINYAENKFNIVIGSKNYECKIYISSQEFEITKPNLLAVNFVKSGNDDISYTQNQNVLIFNEDVSGKLITTNFTCENNFIGQALEVAILRHVFYLYENRSNNELNSKTNIFSGTIESLYSHLISNNYKI